MKGFAMTHSSIKVLSQKMMSLRPITFKRKFGFVLIHIQLGFWQARLKQSVFCKTLLLYIKRTFLGFKIRLHRKTQENNRTSNGIKEILDRDFLLLFIAFGVRHQKKGNWTNSRRFLSNYFFFSTIHLDMTDFIRKKIPFSNHKTDSIYGAVICDVPWHCDRKSYV